MIQDQRRFGSVSHHFLLWSAAAVTVLGFGPLRQELDPWAGTYEVVSVEPSQGDWADPSNRGPLSAADWDRTVIELQPNRKIAIGTYSWCGSCPDQLTRGEANVVGNIIRVMEPQMPYKEASPHPLMLLEIRGRSIMREVPLGGERSIKLIFARVKNASTILDYVGFK